jgi:hypothetical protein
VRHRLVQERGPARNPAGLARRARPRSARSWLFPLNGEVRSLSRLGAARDPAGRGLALAMGAAPSRGDRDAAGGSGRHAEPRSSDPGDLRSRANWRTSSRSGPSPSISVSATRSNAIQGDGKSGPQPAHSRLSMVDRVRGAPVARITRIR